MADCILNQVPLALLIFDNDFGYAEAVSFCEDFDLDILELREQEFSCLFFFTNIEFRICLFFCEVSGFLD